MAQSPTLTLTNAAKQPLSLLDDIAALEALAQVAAKLPQIAAELGVPATLEGLAGAFAKNAAAVRTAFTNAGVGADFGTLTGALDKLTGKPGLLEPLSQLAGGASDGMISWSVSGSEGAPPAAGYSLSLTGQASLTLKAADKWPDAAHPGQLVSVAAAGNVDVSGSLVVPFPPLWSITAGGSASANMSLTYYFDAPAAEAFGVALAQSLPELADPFDLDSVWAAFKNGPLRGIVYTFNGSAMLQVQAALANVGALKLGDVAISPSAAIGVKTSLAGTYTLSLYNSLAANGQVEVSLTRGPTTGTDVSASFGFSADISKATAAVSRAVTAATSDWNAAVAFIGPFLTPGTWLQTTANAKYAEAIKTLVSDPALQDALIQDFQAALGQGAPDGIEGWLTTTINGVIDRGSALTDGKINDAITRVMGELPAFVPALLAQPANQLETLIKTGVTEAEKGLEDKVTQALATASAPFVATLKSLGATTANGFANLDEAMAPVRTLLTKADTEFKKLIGPVQSALQQKVTGMVTYDDATTNQTSVVVKGYFTALDAGARSVFGSLTTGDLQAAVNLVDNATHVPSFKLDTKNSSITRYSKSQTTDGLEIAVFGLDFTFKSVTTATATIFTDGLGNVHATLEGDFSQNYASPRASRQVSFIETAALVHAAALQNAAAGAASLPVLEIGVAATYASNTLGLRDVDGFVTQLAKAGLVSNGCRASADAAFSKLAGTAATMNGSIAGALRLKGEQITTLLRLTGAAGEAAALSDADRLAITQVVLDQLLPIEPSGAGDFKTGRGVYELINDGYDKLSNAAIVLAAIPDLPGLEALPQLGNIPPVVLVPPDSNRENSYKDFFIDVFGVAKLLDMIVQMRATYLSNPSPAPGKPGWSEQDYRNAEQTMAADSAFWVNLYVPLFDLLFSPEVSPWTVAFLKIMSELATIPAASAPQVMVTLTSAPGTDAQKTLSFG